MNYEALKDDLVRDEGLRLKPYRDTVDKLTLGCGRNIEDRGITREEAMYLLQNDIRECEAQLDARIPWWRHLSDARQRVLVNMCFMGIGKLMKFTNMLTALQAGKYERAAKEILNSKYASDVGQRAVRLAEMMRVG